MLCDECAHEAEPPANDPATLAAWQPDHQLIAAVLAGPRALRTIKTKPDRCWCVAGLCAEGMTADAIADRLRTSVRTIRTIMSEPMTKVFRLFFAEAEAFAEELHLVQHELQVRTVALAEVTAEEERVRYQRDRMIDAAMCGEPVRVCKRAGHVMDRYNTYEHPLTGKKSCRLCRYNAQRRARGLPEITELCQLATASLSTGARPATPPTPADV